MRKATMRRISALLALALAVAFGSNAGAAGSRKPRLDLRASPRIAFSPVEVFVVAELVGGEEMEDFHCPGLEWDWDDGAKSAHEADCAPFATGTELERRFTAQHAYRQAGEYTIRVTMRRANRSLAVATARIMVQSGVGGY